MSDKTDMKRDAFLSELRRYCKASGRAYRWEARHGKGSHGRAYVDAAFTTVKDGEIGKVMKEVMLKQLGLEKDAF